MKNLVEKVQANYYRAGAAVAGSGVVLAAPSKAMAVPQDYSDLGTKATSEITAALPVGLAILAVVFGIPLAIGVIKRISR